MLKRSLTRTACKDINPETFALYTRHKLGENSILPIQIRRGRDRDTERETWRERERERERETDRDRDRDRETERERDSQRRPTQIY